MQMMESGHEAMNGAMLGEGGNDTSTHQSPSFLLRGTKRNAGDSDLGDWERFEKRLRMLSLRNAEQKRRDASRRNHTSSHTPPSPATPPEPAATNNAAFPHDTSLPSKTPDTSSSHMNVDFDSPHRVYINDLDAELAEEPTEPDPSTSGDHLIFLPDIMAHFSRIPQQVLTDGSDDNETSRELVLYDVPRSLTQDEGHDSVRKAILEARQRARDKAVEDSRRAEDLERRYGHAIGEDLPVGLETAHGYSNVGYGEDLGEGGLDIREENDPDAMDIG